MYNCYTAFTIVNYKHVRISAEFEFVDIPERQYPVGQYCAPAESGKKIYRVNELYADYGRADEIELEFDGLREENQERIIELLYLANWKGEKRIAKDA